MDRPSWPEDAEGGDPPSRSNTQRSGCDAGMFGAAACQKLTRILPVPFGNVHD